MRKPTISKMFLYRHRFVIGYTILALFFFGLLFFIPFIAPNGLSDAEMQSAVASSGLLKDGIHDSEVVDLPYHALQALSLHFFGLSAYAIKLPSLILGAFLGFFLILLLNRWFKNNVACLASILTVLSGSFLYPATSGTPTIMIIFWPTILLWLGSKIQGIKKPKPFYCFLFAIFLLLSVFTPFMAYLAAFIVLYALFHPHLRFVIKNLPKVPFALISLLVITGLTLIGINLFKSKTAAADLLLMQNFSITTYLDNISYALSPFFSWHGSIDSTVLAPLLGLPTFALALTGLISTFKGFFASRNSIAIYLILFTAFISGFHPEFAILLILPFSILIAHGVRYILEKWYKLFPENPYARVFGFFPISLLLGIIIFSDISHFIFGYRYNPAVADNFSTDLVLIQEHLLDGEPTTLLVDSTLEHDFYHLLENSTFSVTNQKPTDLNGSRLATVGKLSIDTQNLELSRIITSSKSLNSDRIYVYTSKVIEEKKEK